MLGSTTCSFCNVSRALRHSLRSTTGYVIESVGPRTILALVVSSRTYGPRVSASAWSRTDMSVNGRPADVPPLWTHFWRLQRAHIEQLRHDSFNFRKERVVCLISHARALLVFLLSHHEPYSVHLFSHSWPDPLPTVPLMNPILCLLSHPRTVLLCLTIMRWPPADAPSLWGQFLANRAHIEGLCHNSYHFLTRQFMCLFSHS